MDFRNLINSRIDQNDLINNKELSSALEKDKIIRFDFLSTVKPNIIDTKGLKNEKKKNMVEDINLFKKIYYKDYMVNKHSLEKIYKISNENNIFLNHFSGFNKYADIQNQKEILKDIQSEYKKKMGFVPIIKENANLFSNSILLKNDKDLKQYLSLDIDTLKNDSNSLSFLRNVQNKIKITSKNKKNSILEKLSNTNIAYSFDNDNDIPNVRTNIKKYKSANIEKEKEKYESINDLKKDIKKTKDCFNSINNLNFFLNTNNQQYLNYIGDIDSRKSSGEASTRINSGVKRLKNKIKLNDDTIKILINKTNSKMNLYKENNNIDNQKKNNNSKSYNSIILPYIQNNNDSLRNESNNKNNKNNKKQDNKKRQINTIEYIKIDEPNNEEIINGKNEININKNNFNSINNKTKNKKVYKTILRKNQTGVENLYEKISKTDDFIKYNKEIKNYLKKNNYNIDDKINNNDLYKSVDKSRKKITDIKFIQKNNELILNTKIKPFEQSKDRIQNNNKIKKNIENIEERMIGLMCNVNKYSDN